jgi:hypothetical protein
MPAEAGIQNYLKTLDSRLRGNDAEGRFKTFYGTIKFRRLVHFTRHAGYPSTVMASTRTRAVPCL